MNEITVRDSENQQHIRKLEFEHDRDLLQKGMLEALNESANNIEMQVKVLVRSVSFTYAWKQQWKTDISREDLDTIDAVIREQWGKIIQTDELLLTIDNEFGQILCYTAQWDIKGLIQYKNAVLPTVQTTQNAWKEFCGRVFCLDDLKVDDIVLARTNHLVLQWILRKYYNIDAPVRVLEPGEDAMGILESVTFSIGGIECHKQISRSECDRILKELETTRLRA